MNLLKIASHSLNLSINQYVWKELLKNSRSGASFEQVSRIALGFELTPSEFEAHFLNGKCAVLISRTHDIFYCLDLRGEVVVTRKLVFPEDSQEQAQEFYTQVISQGMSAPLLNTLLSRRPFNEFIERE